MPTYLSARRSDTVYDGITPAVRHFPDATAAVIASIMLAYLLPFRLVFPPLSDLGKPGLMVGFGLLVWWALSRLHPSLVTRGQQPMRWAMAIYLVTLFLSYVAGQGRGMPVLEANGAERTLLMALAGAGILLAAADGVLTRERIDKVLGWFCWGAAFMAFVALVQFVTRIDLTTYMKLPPLLTFHKEVVGFRDRGGDGLVRVAGTAGHYIEFSVLMVIGLVVAIHFARFSSTRRDRQIYAVLAMFQAAVIPISLSRTGVLALGAAILLFILVWPLRTTFNVLVVGCFLTALIQVARPGLLAAIKSLLLAGENDPSVQARVEDYDYVAPFIRERPWLGRGIGTFLPELYQLLDNQWLTTLVQGGIVGVAGLAVLFLSGVVVAGRVRRFARTERDRDLAAVLAVAIGVAGVSGFTFDSMYFTTFFITVHVLLGLTGALWRLTRAERTNRIESGRPGRQSDEAEPVPAAAQA
ncbi:O-antigen ligase family protein [Plantactinospora mayteni]|uniref:O-antigen polymerase n=1 Tax=Plantactinospora mayteni TaxID=566021 RepID=A0ABQ4EMH8_9ACTN|nr:O-antigen ligase family protein [Plantactinospora mayteni]GIG95852.1 O-antigen polymerase [Plantactinospora mayteni]